MATTSTRYSTEVRERAMRMVWEHLHEYSSQWAAIASIAPKIGCTTETLRRWIAEFRSAILGAAGLEQLRT
jgi:transposase-like protein